MPNITGPSLSFPTKSFPSNQAGAPAGLVGELTLSELLGKYSTLVKAQKVFYTSAQITAPVIFSTAAQKGPMLWNKPGAAIDAHILGIAVGEPGTATTVAGSIGLSTNVQPSAPTTATSITAVNAYASGSTSQLAGVFSTATVLVTNPVPIYLPLIGVAGAAITVGNTVTATWADVGGLIVVAPGTVGYVCSDATLTTGVFQIGIVWSELPV
jgi:hypothetical protein